MSNIATVKRTFTFLGVPIVADVPATSADWDSITSDGDCVENSIANHGYRGFAAPCRAAMIAALVAKGPGFERKKVTKGDKEVDESEDTYVSRVLEEGKITAEEWVTLAQQAVEAKPVTFVSTMTASNRAKVGQEWLDAAQELMGKWERKEKQADGGEASVERTLGKIRAVLPTATLSDATDVEAVARLLRDHAKALKAASVA